MAVLQCKMCGGRMTVLDGSVVVECEYCGTLQTIPLVDDEKKLKKFDRANRQRMSGEFDRAFGIYESIIEDFPEEAEAYWGLVLCKFGIEYVDDPASGKKIPTCHRTSFAEVMEDSDYQQTLENSTLESRKLYRAEAKKIEELRKRIIEVSSHEDPYDIFICYKETDENGKRTLDSLLAEDIYNALTGKGYRVFFSRITLESKLGVEYEPYIFSALNSAKVMLAVGTDYEHYNAVWVKNEWNRFLKLMTKDSDRHLIACYKGIDAYDMPQEFRKLQAQDLGKVGAIQDLLRGIEKILSKSETTEANVHYATQEAVRSIEQEKIRKQVENAVSLGIMAIDSGEHNKATRHFEEALMLDSECIGAYLGLVRIVSDSGKVAPYVNKITSIPIDQVVEYIRCNKGIIGNLQNDNNLLTVAIKTLRSEGVAQGLLDMGINADAKDALIHYLDKFKNIEIVKKMIDCGANVNATIWWRFNYEKNYNDYREAYYASYTREHHSVLSTAIRLRQSKEIIELLINAGSDVNHSVRAYEYYHKIGERSDGTLKENGTILSLAVAKSYETDVAALLLKAGANVNTITEVFSGGGVGSTKQTYSILDLALRNRKYDWVKLLLSNCADPTIKRVQYIKGWVYYDLKGQYSVLAESIKNIKSFPILKYLLESGADPNSVDMRQITRKYDKETKIIGFAHFNALIDAILYSNDTKMVEVLLSYGANPRSRYYFEKKDDENDTEYATEIPVLGLAIEKRRKDVVKLLIDAGASFDDYVVFNRRGKYAEKDTFTLKELAFGDGVIAEMQDTIRPLGWKGSKDGFFRSAHRCWYSW